ncbi:MAG: sugar phosphate isomerase/epimerase [Bacilli bacterium]|nr:sugar phosphate isomerase/epimerase [Bacilli bacterium]
MDIGTNSFGLGPELKKDFGGTLDKLREAGISHVEAMCNFGHRLILPRPIRKIVFSHPILSGVFRVELFGKKVEEIRSHGLKVISTHVENITFTKKHIEKAVALLRENGIKYVVYSLKTKSIKKVKRMMPGLLAFQKALNDNGMILSFHNHRFEYMDDHGDTVMDYLYREGLNAELDVGWATYVDKDPVEIIKEHGDKLPLLHIKDIAKKGGKVHGRLCVAPGQGIIDLEAILLATKKLKILKILVDKDDSVRGDVIGDNKEAVEAFEKILGK